MVGGVSYFAEKGIVSILIEESKCRLVVTVKPRAPSATEKGLQALPVCCSGKTRPCTRGVQEFGDDDCPVYCLLELTVHTLMT